MHKIDWKNFTVTPEFLKNNSNYVFVFGDNLIRHGRGGAAKCRDCENAYGFITKRYPDTRAISYYSTDVYKEVYRDEIIKLRLKIIKNPDKIFLISKIGSGLANKHKIWENVIEPNIKNDLRGFKDRLIWLF